MDRLSSVLRTGAARTRSVSQVKLIAEPWDIGPGAATRSASFPPQWTEWNGQATATRFAISGAANRPPSVNSPARLTGSPDLYEAFGNGRPVASDQLRHRPRRLHPAKISSPTTRSTTRPTARTTATAKATTAPGTTASKDPPTTTRSSRCANARSATSSRRCCCPRASRCSPTATSWPAPSRATTTRTARTTSSPGSTGSWRATTSCSASTSLGSRRYAPGTRSSAASGSSRAGRSSAPTSTTSPGCGPTVNR